MATIDSRGLVNDGSANLTVTGLTVTGPSAMIVNNTANSGTIAIAAPGFFQLPASGASGQGNLTASLPSALAYPGADMLLTDTLGQFPWLVTGSMSTMSANAVTGSGGQTFMSSSSGTKLVMSAGGTVGFWSDSKSWLVVALSGSCTLKP